jgi:hypothetical protein
VTGLVLIHVLIFAVLVVLLWAGSAFAQGYIYSEPTSQLFWRAPVVAAILTFWLAFWSTREYRAYSEDHVASRYGAIFEFTNSDERPFTEFWVPEGDKRIRYQKRTVAQAKGPGRPEFIAEIPPYQPWSGSEEVILLEDGKEVVYKAQRDQKAKAVLGVAVEGTQGAVYRNDRGKKITEAMIRNGKIESTRWGPLFTYFLLNTGFLVLWFLGLWLLIRFQWLHAVGLAVALWLTAIIFVVPPLVERVDKLVDKKGPQAFREKVTGTSRETINQCVRGCA